MAVLLLIAVVFIASLAVFIAINRRKAKGLQTTAHVMGDFAARNGMRFGRFEANLPARAPDINDLVGSPRIYVDFQLDGTLHGVPFQAFQVRRPPPRRSAITFDVSTRTPEFVAVLVPRPVPGPPLRVAPQRLSWATIFRRDVMVGDAQFDAVFHVSTPTPAFAQHILQPPVTTWLASHPMAGTVVIAFQPRDLMAITPGVLTPDTAMRLADLMTTLRNSLRWQNQHTGPW